LSGKWARFINIPSLLSFMIKEVVSLLKKSLDSLKIDMKKEQIEKIVEIPPSVEMGDFAFPCFFLSEKLKMNPHDAALEVRAE